MYKLNINPMTITRISDRASIPNDPANSDYVAYLKWVALGNTPTPAETQAETLTRVKSIKIESLKTSYQTAISLPIAYMATTFDADEYSINLISRCLSVGSVSSGFYWVSSANVKVTMTFIDLQGLAGAILTRGQTNFTNLFDKKTLVLGALTETDVNSIFW